MARKVEEKQMRPPEEKKLAAAELEADIGDAAECLAEIAVRLGYTAVEIEQLKLRLCDAIDAAIAEAREGLTGQ
jgi:hypothetical protein